MKTLENIINEIKLTNKFDIDLFNQCNDFDLKLFLEKNRDLIENLAFEFIWDCQSCFKLNIAEAQDYQIQLICLQKNEIQQFKLKENSYLKILEGNVEITEFTQEKANNFYELQLLDYKKNIYNLKTYDFINTKNNDQLLKINPINDLVVLLYIGKNDQLKFIELKEKIIVMNKASLNFKFNKKISILNYYFMKSKETSESFNFEEHFDIHDLSDLLILCTLPRYNFFNNNLKVHINNYLNKLNIPISDIKNDV